MRPYLAIVADSFHAAFASRVLWLALAAIVVVLIALAPIGYHQVLTTEFQPSDISSGNRLVGRLAESLVQPERSAARQVAEALPASMQQQLIEAAEEGTAPPNPFEILGELNRLLRGDAGWYDAELWRTTPRLRELRELDAMESSAMDSTLRQRRNRLRIESALAGAFQVRPTQSLAITYATLEFPAPLQMRHDQFVEVLNTLVLPQIVNLLLGVIAVFTGILVTSTVIPEMLQPGSLHALLSKPISRPLLFLSKFVGGCAFVLLCVSLLISGLWLIALWRLDLSNPRLFLCIPVFVFLFAVYYSVAALVALLWRSAILSIGATVLFWLGCFLIGQAGGMFDSLIIEPSRATRLAVGPSQVFLANQQGSRLQLSEEADRWEVLEEGDFYNRVLGPVRLGDGTVVSGQMQTGRFFGNRNVELALHSPEHHGTASAGTASAGTASAGPPEGESTSPSPQATGPGASAPRGVTIPPGTTELLAAGSGGLFTVSGGGIYYAAAEGLTAPRSEEDEQETSPAGGFLSGLRQLLGGTTPHFTAVLPDGFAWSSPRAVAVVPGSDDLVVFAAGRLTRLERIDSQPRWRVAAQRDVEGDPSREVRLVATPHSVLLVPARQSARLLDVQTLELRREIELDSQALVRQLSPSPRDDQIALLDSDRTLRLLDGSTGELRTPRLRRQGRIDSILWLDPDRIYAAYRSDQLLAFDPLAGDRLWFDRSLPISFWRRIHDWGIEPLRSIVPQTGELGETVTAIVCGQRAIDFEAFFSQEDAPPPKRLNVVRPLATCGGFIAVMLTLSCVYFSRQDF